MAPLDAHAQSVTLQSTAVEFLQANRRPESQNLRWISRQDCLDNVTIRFRPRLTNYQGMSLGVWISQKADCTVKDNRETDTSTCLNVYSEAPDGPDPEVLISARQIARLFGGRSGTSDETCDQCLLAKGSDDPQEVVFYFMLVTSGTKELPEGSVYATWTETKVDLLGPPAPTSVTAGTGDERLIIGFKPPTSGSIAGYRFYADDGTGAPFAGFECTGVAAPGGAAGTAGATGGAGDGGGSGVGGASGGAWAGSAGASGAGANGPCYSRALVPGEIPDEALGRDTISSSLANEGRATGLTNGTTYVVGVAAYDNVGNVGVLSETACGTPAAVTGFYEMYREAGGDAGGGFCSVSRRSGSAAGFVLLGALSLAWARRRRS
jgi:hypothetical protein